MLIPILVQAEEQYMPFVPGLGWNALLHCWQIDVDCMKDSCYISCVGQPGELRAGFFEGTNFKITTYIYS